MAKVYISEYARMTLDNRGLLSAAEEPALATQVLDTTGTHLSAAFNAGTRFVRLHTDAIVSVKFATGSDPTATTSHPRMAANQTEYFGIPVSGSTKVDVVANT